jgi:transposase
MPVMTGPGTDPIPPAAVYLYSPERTRPCLSEGFVREFANGKALGSYAGLAATPYSSGGIEREQGISKAGNAWLRTVMVELAWLWQRYQPGSAQVRWFRTRISGTGGRMRKVMVVALARKLLIALWRFATQGVVPEGAIMKPAS